MQVEVFQVFSYEPNTCSDCGAILSSAFHYRRKKEGKLLCRRCRAKKHIKEIIEKRRRSSDDTNAL